VILPRGTDSRPGGRPAGGGTLVRVRLSEFWRLAEGELGPSYARSVTATQVVGRLGHRTPDEALADGVPPRDVWEALCDVMDVPPERRLGADPARRRPRG
jgi:hypothetical protein